ncbi:YIP1 family protein [Candidatus Micrarchaeota archaeon]|nr:YIP1 family protein [Candidatus Micrarchaeota archaeon]
MAYQELVNYVRATRARGYGDGDIRRALSSEGWREDDVEEAFSAANLMRNRLIRPNADAGDFSPANDKPAQDGKPAKNGGRALQEPASQDRPRPSGIPVPDDSQAKFSLLSAYFSTIFHPVHTLGRARYHASIWKGIVGYALFALIAGAIPLVLVMALPAFATTVSGAAVLYSGSGALLGIGVGLALAIVGSFSYNAIVYAFCRLLGGAGSFGQQYFVNSVAESASFIIVLIVKLFVLALQLAGFTQPVGIGGMVLPAFRAVWLILALPLIIYLLALRVIALKEAHKFSTAKALAVNWSAPLFRYV